MPATGYERHADPHPADWPRILSGDERLLWEGRPAPGLSLRDWLGGPAFGGLALIVMGAVWLTMSGQILGGARIGLRDTPEMLRHVPKIGWALMALGGYELLGRPLWRAWRRNGHRYALSDRAAYVSRRGLTGSQVRRVALAEMNILTLDPGGHGIAGSVWFLRETWTEWHSTERGSSRQTRTRRVGFERIPDAPRVARLIGDLKAGKPPA